MIKPSRSSGFISLLRSVKPARTRGGFTLIEVMMVMVLVAIISGISIPYFAGTFRGSKLRSAARTIERVSRYTRSMAIMREETLTMVLNRDTMELFMGAKKQAADDTADGQLDQEVLKRLHYTEGDADETSNIEKELHRLLPKGITVGDFEKNQTDINEDFCVVNFYPNGQCDWFKLKLEDNKGHGMQLEIDPVSGRIRSEFVQ